jgi:hypothetical protein
LSCPIERTCQYSAIQIYDDARLKIGYTHWLPHVVHDIEDILSTHGEDAARRSLHAALSQDWDRNTHTDAEIASRPWYGRCVWDSDNNVCDDQTVTLTFPASPSTNQPGKIATLHMISNTENECIRQGVIYGTRGELSYDGKIIRYFDFESRTATEINAPKTPEEETKIKSHGGGDGGLANAFVDAAYAVERQGIGFAEAQEKLVGCTLDDVIRGHAIVFAAEEARREERIVRWGEWWESKSAD